MRVCARAEGGGLAVTRENMKPSEIFLGLWRQWARTDKSGVEDFTACAEAWAEIRRMERWMEAKEAEERRFFENLAGTAEVKILRCAQDDKEKSAQDDKETKDAGGASPSPTEENETARVYSAYVDYAGEMHGPTEGPLPTGTPEETRAAEGGGPYKETEPAAEGVQSGPEAVKKGPWRHRRERVQKRLLATKFSTQAIVDKSGREVTVGDVRTFADDCDALPARKVGAIEDALNALEGTV